MKSIPRTVRFLLLCVHLPEFLNLFPVKSTRNNLQTRGVWKIICMALGVCKEDRFKTVVTNIIILQIICRKIFRVVESEIESKDRLLKKGNVRELEDFMVVNRSGRLRIRNSRNFDSEFLKKELC